MFLCCYRFSANKDLYNVLARDGRQSTRPDITRRCRPTRWPDSRSRNRMKEIVFIRCYSLICVVTKHYILFYMWQPAAYSVGPTMSAVSVGSCVRANESIIFMVQAFTAKSRSAVDVACLCRVEIAKNSTDYSGSSEVGSATTKLNPGDVYIGWQWRNIVPYLCQLILPPCCR